VTSVSVLLSLDLVLRVGCSCFFIELGMGGFRFQRVLSLSLGCAYLFPVLDVLYLFDVGFTQVALYTVYLAKAVVS
jgi:hypothetical protein